MGDDYDDLAAQLEDEGEVPRWPSAQELRASALRVDRRVEFLERVAAEHGWAGLEGSAAIFGGVTLTRMR